jgi:hypothetical protein
MLFTTGILQRFYQLFNISMIKAIHRRGAEEVEASQREEESVASVSSAPRR